MMNERQRNGRKLKGTGKLASDEAESEARHSPDKKKRGDEDEDE